MWRNTIVKGALYIAIVWIVLLALTALVVTSSEDQFRRDIYSDMNG